MRGKLYQLLIFNIMFFGVNCGLVVAANSQLKPLEVIYSEIGYTTVEEAVSKFEQHFKRDLKLPVRVPPLSFTHYFGRFNDQDGDTNDSLEIQYLNEDSPGHHYKIDIRPIGHKIPMRANDTYELRNGTKAIYTNVTNFNLLVFERDGWQYILSVDKRASDQVTAEVLVKIANSIGGLD
ncbi:hypothetical protein [Mesobacillus thioparans]|uniref:hypothetical protein n=1 Tax=Mesobacillus thioparans TaxID=370439 RepID=UPI0039F01F8D